CELRLPVARTLQRRESPPHSRLRVAEQKASSSASALAPELRHRARDSQRHTVALFELSIPRSRCFVRSWSEAGSASYQTFSSFHEGLEGRERSISRTAPAGTYPWRSVAPGKEDSRGYHQEQCIQYSCCSDTVLLV